MNYIPSVKITPGMKALLTRCFRSSVGFLPGGRKTENTWLGAFFILRIILNLIVVLFSIPFILLGIAAKYMVAGICYGWTAFDKVQD